MYLCRANRERFAPSINPLTSRKTTMERNYKVVITLFSGELNAYETYKFQTARDIYSNWLCSAKCGTLSRLHNGTDAIEISSFSNSETLFGRCY